MTRTEKVIAAGVLITAIAAVCLTVLAVREVRECGSIALGTQDRDGREYTAFECTGGKQE